MVDPFDIFCLRFGRRCSRLQQDSQGEEVVITHHKVVIGDSRRMSEIEDESIHLVITSPPYWQLKDYGVKGQTGFDDSYEEYINNLNLVSFQTVRTTREEGHTMQELDFTQQPVYRGRGLLRR